MILESPKIPEVTKQRLDADTPWKNILDLYFQQFMNICLPDIAAKIDWARGYEILDKELTPIVRGAHIGKRLADKLIKVWLLTEQDISILFHIEVQGRKEQYFSERMFVYYYRLRDIYKQPIISIVILTDSNPNWRPSYFYESYFDCAIEMRYCLIKILDFAKTRAELEMINNAFAMVILAQLTLLETSSHPKDRFLTKLSLTRQLYERNLDKNDIFQLLTFIDWLIVLPEPFVLEYREQVRKIEEEKQMPYITTFERYGLKIGMERGMQQGIQKGEQKGMAKIILRLLQRRFGLIPDHYVQRILESDIQTLLDMEEKIVDAKTLEEFF